MSAGLLASMVTPGSTAPDESRTVPVMLLCAKAVTGAKRRPQTTNEGTRTHFMASVLAFPVAACDHGSTSAAVVSVRVRKLRVDDRDFKPPITRGQEEKTSEAH